MELNAYETIAYSSILALSITLGVTAYFHYLKPSKSDQVFVSNRNSSLEMIINQLNIFDKFWLDDILKVMTKEFGKLKREREDLLKNTFKFFSIDEIEKQEPGNFIEGMRETAKLKELRDTFKVRCKNMVNSHKTYTDEKILFEKYLHHDFLKNIDMYYYSTNYYVEWLLKAVIVSSCMDDRKNYAEKIIKYLKDDKSIDKKSNSIEQFIERWDDELKRGT